MKRKILMIGCFFIALLTIFVIFFYKNNYKKHIIGNNITNKSLDEYEEYILGINSFKAKVEISVNSNKNTNKYLIEQEGTLSEYKQKILEPKNIEGIETLYKDNRLTINNTNLGLNKIYEDYSCIANNKLNLIDFIVQYKNNQGIKESRIEEKEEDIFLSINTANDTVENLYIDKNSCKPTEMIVKNNNGKEIIYILYKEIIINND